eukprot:3518354-Prymnesium_polylepis.1
MGRKLILTGFLMVIDEESEQCRILVALFTSVGFLALQLSIKPYKRPEDEALMTLVMLSLVLMYVCALLIKSCGVSAVLCSTFGLGDSANGVCTRTSKNPFRRRPESSKSTKMLKIKFPFVR